jgi:pimeloyl-ACP methyl ester carboxylesterase
MDAVWGNRFVTEAAVTSRIKQARRALGDDGQAQRVIRTVHGRGYRFVAEVGGATPRRRTDDARDLSLRPSAPVRYTVSDGLHIAYQVTGSGPRDIVLVSGFISHLELDWGDPRHAHALDRLGRLGRLIRFDKRGTGMSDRPPGVPDVETRMHDVLAVMDAVDSKRAVLFGYSEGGAMACLFAATHPERVESLVLYGCYAKRTWAPDYPWAVTEEKRQAYTDELVKRWDWEADALMRMPSADAAMQKWWAQRMRASATPTTVRALMDMNSLVDVRDALPSIRVPTLVLHRRGDALFRVEEAQYLAEQIPDAQLQLLDGDDHFIASDPDQILDVIEPFIASAAAPQRQSTSLAAVLSVRGSGAALVNRRLVGAGARPRTTTWGDDVLLFDGPATAVRAVLADPLSDTAVGIVVAEVPRDGKLAGNTLRGCTDLVTDAPPGEIWVSSTVGMLLGGSGIELEPTGADGPDGQGVLRVVR